MNLNAISFFQFDNLITNETLLLYDKALYQQHLSSVEFRTNSLEALELLSRKQHPKHEAILVICPNGQLSESLVVDLEKAGYLNVFFVLGGLQSLRADALR